MSTEPNERDPATTEPGAEAPGADPVRRDPNDDIPVPDVMYPAELDARGDAVNALREKAGLPVPETHDEDRGASYA